jgi:hypothetical protein
MVTETKQLKLTRFVRVLTGAIVFVLAAASAQAQFTLSLGSASNPDCTTDELSVVLAVQDATNLGGFNVEVIFDEANLDFVGAVRGDALGPNGANWSLVNSNQPDPNDGRVILAGSRLVGTTVSGDVELMTLTFTCIPGSCANVTALELQNLGGGVSTATPVNGQIVCGQLPTVASLDVTAGCPGEEFIVPVVASNLAAPIGGFQVEMFFDTTELAFLGTQPGDATAAANWSLVNGNQPDTNVGRIVLAGSRLVGTTIPGGELIKVRFNSLACDIDSELTLANAGGAIAGVQLVGSTVSLVGNADPVAACQNITVNLSEGSFDAADLNNGSTDEDGDTLAFTIGTIDGPTSQAVTCNDVDNPLTITLFVSDGVGGTDTCEATVTVVDDIDPSITANAGVSITLDANGDATVDVNALVASATDNCGTPDVTANVTAVDCSDVGPLAITLTATDASGNTATAVANVTVVDNTDPVVTAVANVVEVALGTGGTAAINAAALTASATDACGAPTVTASPSAVNCDNIGPVAVTLTATDSSGNTSTAIANINVVDNIAPTVVTRNIDVTLDANGEATITAAQINNGSSDNCTAAGALTLSLDVDSFDCSDEGANVVNLTVTDAEGNSASAPATVTVTDATDPTLTLNAGPFVVELDDNGNGTLSVATVVADATDACGIDGEASLGQTAFDCSDLGENTIAVSVTDVNGNTTTDSITVTVEDNTAPVVDFVAATIQLQLNDAGVATLDAAQTVTSATDNCGTPTGALSVSTFGCDAVGATQTVDVVFSDASGNETSGSVTVEVLDSVDPVAVAQDITVEIGEDAAAVTITAEQIDNGSSDACGVELSIDVDTFSCLNVGPNTVTLTATDPSGNTATATATVTVTNPSGSCNPEGEGEGIVEGEGEGVDEEVCVDTDGNGIPDNAFTCLLAGDSNQVIQQGVDGGCLVNTVTVAFSNTGQGGNVVLNNIADPNNNDISFTVSFPVDSIAEGSNGVVVFQIGCDLENLLLGDDSATTLFGNLALANVPVDEQIDGSPYISVNIIENGLSKIERLDASVTVTMSGSDANTVEDPTLFVHGAEAVDASPDAGDQIAIQGEASCAPAASCWQPVDGAVSAQAVVTATISSGNVALFTQPEPQVPFLKVSPNPAFDRIFGFVAPNTTSAPANFTLTNIGPGLVTGTATITSQTPALASAFSIVAATSNTNYNLGPDGSAPVNVTFRPAAAGVNYTAVLSLTNTSVPEGSPNRVVEITLRGTGANGATKGGILGCGMTDQGGFGFADGALVLLVLMALALGGRAYGKVRQH